MKLSLYNLRKGFRYLKNYGLKEFFIRLKEKENRSRFPMRNMQQAIR